MSFLLCILVAAVAKTWKQLIIMAVIAGLFGSAFFGWLKWQDTHYTSLPVEYLAKYVAIGTTAFVFETVLFFAVRLGFRGWLARRRNARSEVGAKVGIEGSPES
jgi:hypothetical protein